MSCFWRITQHACQLNVDEIRVGNECTLAVDDAGGGRKTWRLMDTTQRRWSQLESRGLGDNADQTGLNYAQEAIDFEKQTSPVS